MKAVVLDWATMAPDALDTDELSALPVEWTFYDETSSEQTAGRIANADIIFTNKVVLDETELRASACRYIGVLATGTNNIDLKYCEDNGIVVNNVAGYGTETVAQHTLMLLLNLATRFADYHRDVQSGKWTAASQFCLNNYAVMELAGKHAVIVGHGDLGQRVESLYRALGMRVSVAARPGKADDTRPTLDSLAPTADVLSLHCQLSEQTHQLVDEALLALLPDHAFIINTARGGLIDEAALLHALQQQQIGGAGLDVLSEEPPPASHPLMQVSLPTLLITPHSAWLAREARQRLLDDAVKQLATFLKQAG
ncbi:D-2-hydroxyacid dehydrogenase [Alteromonas sp. H39]|uniref:D-2-hydroxyacid dehydrogenase n=1 Tax=Alteromonas sp. H39 TaxID=3389876 RepID=UPI0039E0EAF3